MTQINLGAVIKATTFSKYNFIPRYEDGTDMYDMAGKIILFFEKEKSAESVTIPIIYESAQTYLKGDITINRNGESNIEWKNRG